MDTPEMFDHLTEMEGRILDLKSQGWNQAEVGQELNLSQASVTYHAENLLRFLDIPQRGVNGMCRAVTLAWEVGFFDSPIEVILGNSMPLKYVEWEAIHHASLGHTAEEDARERNITLRKVAYERRRARLKLGALTLPHLVRCSYQLGILPFHAGNKQASQYVAERQP